MCYSIYDRKERYPGDNQARLLLKNIEDSIFYYSRIYNGRIIEILLSNGKTLLFHMKNDNLLHFVGINVYDLIGKSIEFSKLKTQLEFLQFIVRSKKKILEINKEHNYSLLDFEKIQNKLTALLNLSDYTLFDFCILNFDREIAKEWCTPAMKSDYFLFNPSCDDCVATLGIKSNQKAAETIFNCERHNQELKFRNQKVSYPIIIREYGIDKKLLSENILDDENFYSLYATLKNLTQDFNCRIIDEFYYDQFLKSPNKFILKKTN